MSMHSAHWSQAVARLQQTATPHAVATVIATAGSTPRNAGSKIVVSAADTWDSIGGGQFEYLVVNRARELLQSGSTAQEMKLFPLAAEAGQCCGGSVAVLLEVFVPQTHCVAIFGAGHVAQALVKILAETPLALQWIDSRADLLATAPTSGNLHCRVLADPEQAIETLPSGCQTLVLTHDHALDYRLVYRLLSNYRWCSVGLIGSETKAQRFRHRLLRDGVSAQALSELECPVGLQTVKGKLPMEVAVSIAAGVLARLPEDSAVSNRGMSWPEMRDVLRESSEHADTESQNCVTQDAETQGPESKHLETD